MHMWYICIFDIFANFFNRSADHNLYGRVNYKINVFNLQYSFGETWHVMDRHVICCFPCMKDLDMQNITAAQSNVWSQNENLMHVPYNLSFEILDSFNFLLFSVSCPIREQMFLSWRGWTKSWKQSGTWWDGLTKMSEAHFVWSTISKLTLEHGANNS